MFQLEEWFKCNLFVDLALETCQKTSSTTKDHIDRTESKALQVDAEQVGAPIHRQLFGSSNHLATAPTLQLVALVKPLGASESLEHLPHGIRILVPQKSSSADESSSAQSLTIVISRDNPPSVNGSKFALV